MGIALDFQAPFSILGHLATAAGDDSFRSEVVRSGHILPLLFDICSVFVRSLFGDCSMRV
jgi:hypothetical protein